MTDPAGELASRLANRMLADEGWARDRLASHAGRTFTARVSLASSAFRVAPDGAIETLALEPGVRPDLELSVGALDVPSLLADPTRWPRLVTAHGDLALAATLADLAQTLPWFVERAFSQLLGPVVGQRVADVGRALLDFPGQAKGRLADSAVSYARDEADLLVPGAEGRVFADQVSTVARRTDALGDRLERLAGAIDAAGPRPVA